MASIFKPTYTKTDPKTGKKVTKRLKKWYVKYRDSDDRERKVPGFTDKGATLKLAARLEREAELARQGMGDPYHKQRKRPLKEHIDEFEQHLRDKGNSADHVRLTLDRVRKICTSCKFIFMGDNDAPVESVLLPAPDGATYCLSVACGCPVGCAFCASGTFFRRHLAAGEILDQYLLMRAISGDDPPFSGIVLMGMGEPLLNWRGTRGFLEDMTRNAGVGARRITVSTVGVPRGIAALGESFPQVKLAVSLHAADDALRRRLVPYAARVNLRALMAACRRHAELTRGRRITFEYVLLAGVNDRAEDAARLASLVRGLPAAVNLIPFNPTAQGVFARPSDAAVEAFARALRRRFRGEVVVRRSLGAGVHAACGQLGAQCASRAGT